MRYVIAVALLAALTGCGSQPLQVRGTLTLEGGVQEIHWLNPAAEAADDAPCEGDSGYSDISQGTDVVVRDSNNKRVGLGRLGVGHGAGDTCVFTFHVNVDNPDDLLSVEVAHRGDVSFKRAEATSVALTLGS